MSQPPLRFTVEEIMRDPDKVWRLSELGEFALKESLTTYLASAYPEAPSGLLTDLRQANLSRHNLTLVAERLESAGLILVMKVKENGKDYIERIGNHFGIGMDDYGYGIAGDIPVDRINDIHKLWERCMAQVQKNGKAEDVKRVAMKELGQGFRAGMYNYAMQVAGVIYVDSKYDLHKFWEKYNKHLKPIISPADLQNRRAAASAFEDEMKSLIEAVPRFQIVYLNKNE